VVVADGLDWARYDGQDGLAAGALGTRAPSAPPLGPGGLATVEAVLVPALAVDHDGVRLGRGGGYYDRALASVPAGVPLAALLHDGELVRRLPADPWDRNVTSAVEPAIGWTEPPIVEHHVR
jgi:5-formyltetrahydrofolate cyclo-ligase